MNRPPTLFVGLARALSVQPPQVLTAALGAVLTVGAGAGASKLNSIDPWVSKACSFNSLKE